MCGIFGVLDSKVNKSLVKRMGNVLKYRGPDDEGYFFGGNVAIGSRRLSIIDIKSGHQPIHNEDRTIQIVFNGEIYNFQELRKILGKKHKFYTKSDTEVVVHAYEEWGEKCVERFNGMWAFALWDGNKKKLFLSRDRFGEKPLYYFFDGRKLVFASEIKALFEDRSIERIPNDKMVYEYLMYGLHDHSEETFFRGIKRLLPAHSMTVDGNGLKIERYWDLKVNKSFDFSSEKDEEYARKFYEILEDSVRLRLISEVPIGTCLSGGLDSTSIVSIINRILVSGGVSKELIGRKQKTFSAVYRDEEIDERKYIDEVAEFTGIEKNYVSPGSKELWKEVKKLVYHQDEPFGGMSIYAQWNVMRLAKKKVTVVLDGQGGDELLAGYIPYYSIYFSNLWKRKKVLRLAKEVLMSLDLTLPFIKKFLSESRKDIGTKKMLDKNFASEFENKSESKWKGNDLGDFLYLEMTRNSLPRLLRYEDKNSMAFSVESRVPFLDHRIAEYVFSLPINQRIKNGWTKHLLRNAMKSVVPESVRKRRSKIGFAVPEKRWLLELRKDVKKKISSEKFGKRKYFDRKEIMKKFDDFCKGKIGDSYTRVFWRILILEFWLEVFFDKD